MPEEPVVEPPDVAAPPTGTGWLRVFWIGIPLVYAVLLLFGWDRIGDKDHGQLLTFHSLQYWNAELFGFARQWTPVLCGGFSLAGDPQVPILSLGMLGGYLLGPQSGIRVATLAYLVVGWVGAYLYAGLLTSRREPRALAASLFIGNGFFVCRLSYGHVTFMPFLALPLVLWLLHLSLRPAPASEPAQKLVATGTLTLGLSAILALAIDGSPVAILHLLPWCGVYALTLSFVTRRAGPIFVFGAAVAGAALLDAAYLLPMIVAQESYPRLRPDTFTNPLVLVWFMILPLRGRLLPAPTNGHELSVFAGPIVVWLIVRHRRWLSRLVPSSLSTPLLVTSAVAVWFGMGSLASLGVPEVLSPFDWLRSLPGFRSMGVTGRFWGFLALPLSLLGAPALLRAASRETPRRFRTLVILLFLFQFGFQIETVVEHLLLSPRYVAAHTEGLYDRPERIEFVASGPRDQALVVTPTRCVVDCYNRHDFLQPPMETGDRLIVEARSDVGATEPEKAIEAAFPDWNTIRIRRSGGSIADAESSWTLVLNQAFHPLWITDAGSISRTPEGNLVVRSVPSEALERGVELRFRDPASVRGVAISGSSWTAAAILALVLAFLGHLGPTELRRRSPGAGPLVPMPAVDPPSRSVVDRPRQAGARERDPGVTSSSYGGDLPPGGSADRRGTGKGP